MRRLAPSGIELLFVALLLAGVALVVLALLGVLQGDPGGPEGNVPGG